MRVAIVDDDPVSRKILGASLVRFGHEVVEFSDGQAAWDALQDGSLRLVITDWMMPGIDGLELTRRIRNANFDGYVYVIILTGRENKSDVVAGLEAGADDYLVKPYDVYELRARVAIGLRVLELEARLKIAAEQMQEMALHDSLTGLLNRRAIYTHYQGELNRSGRLMTPLSLAMIDIDHFKQINDQYGHLLGDKALCLCADKIKKNLRSYDWVGRWGGDEFLAILPGAEPAEAVTIVERIREDINEEPLSLENGGKMQVQFSAGVICILEKTENLDILIQMADRAMYQAKEDGRSRTVVVEKDSKK